jgi:hypothetical protein
MRKSAIWPFIRRSGPSRVALWAVRDLGGRIVAVISSSRLIFTVTIVLVVGEITECLWIFVYSTLAFGVVVLSTTVPLIILRSSFIVLPIIVLVILAIPVSMRNGIISV